MTMPKQKVFLPASRLSWSKVEFLKQSNKRFQKPSATLKATITESGYIQDWATKARWSLKRN